MEGAEEETENMIVEMKRGFLDIQKDHILAEDVNCNFFKHVKQFSRFEKPKLFDFRMLLPGKGDEEVAEHLAAYFNRILEEFDPLKDE